MTGADRIRLAVPRTVADALARRSPAACPPVCPIEVAVAALVARLDHAEVRAGSHGHAVRLDSSFEENLRHPADGGDVIVRVMADGDGIEVAIEGTAPVPVRLSDAHVERFLGAVAAEPATRLADAPLLGPDEYDRIVRRWNDTSATVADRTGDQLVAAQAVATPDAPAVVDGDTTLTYAQLDRAAEALAVRLRGHGAAGGLVAVCLPRTSLCVIALLAVWKAGAAYVPLDPALPELRLRRLLDAAGVAILIAVRAEDVTWAGAGVSVVEVCGDGPAADGPDTASGGIRSELAYAIPTSGSTGEPKIVEITHRSLTNLLTTMPAALGWSSADTLLSVSSIGFDIAALEIFGPLSLGAKVVLAGPDDIRDGRRLAAALVKSAATVMQATPSMWSLLASCGEAIPRIDAVCGGEALPPSLAARLLPQVVRLWNVYGPTETTVWSTMTEIGASDVADPPVGRPIANTSVYVLDAAGQPVPAGQPGEVWIGGAGVARGYAGDERLTAQRFRSDPFRGGRMYRTGDLGTFLDDGRLRVHGRRDDLVKIRGHRVELTEVESVLREAPGVAQAAVVAHRHPDGSTALVAHIVPLDSALPASEVRRFARARLGSAMVPRRIVMTDRIPLTVGGKVDRAELRRRVATAPAGPDPARSPLQRALAGIWSEVLDVAGIGPADNFFFIGGDSLDAAAVSLVIEQRTGAVVFVASLFTFPTLQSFAGHIAKEYPHAAQILAGGACGPASAAAAAEPPVDDGDVEAFRALFPHRDDPVSGNPDREGSPGAAAFVLCAPRSGSTLLRVMLAGSSRLFVPPELELLGFETVDERERTLVGRYRSLRDGLLSALCLLVGCGPAEAEAYFARHCAGRSTLEVYRLLQSLVGDRLIIDKTTTYAMDRAALDRARRGFHEARYIHLVRHPNAVIASYEDAHLDVWFRQDAPFTRRRLAELIWIVSVENVQALAAEGEPVLVVRFEDLLARPEPVLREICAFLDVPYEPGMLTPYDGDRRRMTSGLHPQSRMAGDYKFGRFDGIRGDFADAWRLRPAVQLAPPTRALAARYGYTTAGEGQP